MKLKIDLEECLRDSPNFRYADLLYLSIPLLKIIIYRNYLDSEENNVEILEQKLDKVLRQCNDMIIAGKNYVGQQR